MPRSFRTLPLGPLGAFAVAALSGCGGAELAATEDPQAPPPAAPVAAPSDPAPAPIAAASAAPPAAAPRVAAAPLPPEPPADWDFFGPPVDPVAADQAGPRTEHLHLRGFWDVDGRRIAQLWAGRSDGTGQMLLLAAGESGAGVTVVELGEDTATIEHPERVVLTMNPNRDRSAAARPGTVQTGTSGPAVGWPSTPVAAPRSRSRPESAASYRPPPPPPRPSADRLGRDHAD
ncbi:hypothetical protein [Alienimonas californiensis]|uniref:Uncharacterized protein n=1 Tax=Alienimonas californiensis TaxID=2527989 RepID=A0A517P8X9_9PLAN|nr:hypothetical protein [Alienimonas californiensis]QDT15821.1 hypothetical protein CA12_19160 [Alienimonas californiensis]